MHFRHLLPHFFLFPLSQWESSSGMCSRLYFSVTDEMQAVFISLFINLTVYVYEQILSAKKDPVAKRKKRTPRVWRLLSRVLMRSRTSNTYQPKAQALAQCS